jgi:anti-sigma factor RsiW
VLTCQEAISRLADLEVGELDVGEKRGMERHLAGCRSCLSYWQSYRTTVALARRACSEEDARNLPMPEDLSRRILDRAGFGFQVSGFRKPVLHVVHLLSGIAAAPLLVFWLR